MLAPAADRGRSPHSSSLYLAALGLALVFFALPVPVDAQSTPKVPRVGYVGFQGELPRASPLRDAFVRGLRDLGYVPGKNITLDVHRWATGDELVQVLSELVRLKSDVIFVGPPIAAMAAKQVTREIPIVCGSCGDPVENGLAASLARPGGNVTGLASLSAELIGKRVALVKELLPGASRVAVFLFPANPGTRPTLKALETAGRTLGIELQRIEIRGAGDFDNAFRSAATGGAGAVVLQDDPLVRSARTQIAALALKHRLPVSSGLLEAVEAGALMAYGLPFEQITKLDLVLNLKTAKALGLTIPQSFLLRADRVIE